ncbi:MAG TPA: hypothetical protein VH682_06175 [Gemmataceae bacterium]
MAETYWYVLCGSFHHTDREGQTAAGLLMMPLALEMLGVELWLLRRLFVDRSRSRLTPIRFRQLPPLGACRRPREAQVMH